MTVSAQGLNEQMSVELEARLTTLELSIIPHPSHLYALGELEKGLARARMMKDGRRLSARLRLIYGESGAGKTTLIEHLATRYPDTSNDDGDVRPIIVVEMPEATTKKALVRAVLDEMGYKAAAADSANSIIKDIADKVNRLGVEMIIIDEGHHMISGKAVAAVSEFLKSLLNRVKCQIVIAGCPELAVLHQFTQLDRRLIPDIVLEPYDWTTAAGRLEFLALLANFELLMRLPEESRLASQDFAMRLYVATGGSIGIVAKYLSRAVELATERGLKKIDKELMAEIFASWHPDRSVPTTIDFCAELVIPKGATQDTLSALASELRAISINPDTNPFACTPQTCAKLWAARTGSFDPVSPRRRTFGTGPVPMPVFTH